MSEKVDNIYLYLWEELKTVYIGRTINPKVRDYVYKTRKSEKTYQFCAEHNVEHPKMIILETGLSVEDGVEREKFWIEKYRKNNNYVVLNKRKGGQIGNQHSVYSEQELKEHKKEYYKENKEKRILYQKEYNKKNKEKIKKYQKNYFDKHKEEKKEYDKTYARKWYIMHREKRLAYSKARRILNKK